MCDHCPQPLQLTRPLTYEEREWWACKVCDNVPDETGILTHGKGCYCVSEDGGGDSYEDFLHDLQHGRVKVLPLRTELLAKGVLVPAPQTAPVQIVIQPTAPFPEIPGLPFADQKVLARRLREADQHQRLVQGWEPNRKGVPLEKAPRRKRRK